MCLHYLFSLFLVYLLFSVISKFLTNFFAVVVVVIVVYERISLMNKMMLFQWYSPTPPPRSAFLAPFLRSPSCPLCFFPSPPIAFLHFRRFYFRIYWLINEINYFVTILSMVFCLNFALICSSHPLIFLLISKSLFIFLLFESLIALLI